ncbi:MAG: carbon-nitrogen hydrolase family protein [Pseudoclavibacter sp.]|nr:carbon-nitrogen hydrolase family protein [Pseudoclavibacter sp.]
MDTSRTIRAVLVQAPPRPIGEPLDGFEREVRTVLEAHPDAQLLAFPELHLFGADRPDPAEQNGLLREGAVPIDGELLAGLGEIARRAGVALVPGSVCERDGSGRLFNTAPCFDRDGRLLGAYRKIFPWRPSEPYDPGSAFTVVELEGVRLGLSICYDAWFPEHARQLAWLGAEAIVNIVKTTTPDRAQELVLARANAIANQLFVLSVNAAGPLGRGRSIAAGPEGEVLAESPTAAACTLPVHVEAGRVERVRREGTAGCTLPWQALREGDPDIPLPLYGGAIRAGRWRPQRPEAAEAAAAAPRETS